jgi:hypothetical protein
VLSAGTIFTGKIIRLEGKPGSMDVKIAVEETLRGEPQNRRQVHISDYSDSKDIEALFRKNKMARLLVLGSHSISLDDKNLNVPWKTADSCTKPTKLSNMFASA